MLTLSLNNAPERYSLLTMTFSLKLLIVWWVNLNLCNSFKEDKCIGWMEFWKKKTKTPHKTKTKTKRMITNINMCRQNSIWPCYFFITRILYQFIFQILVKFSFLHYRLIFLIREFTFQNEDFLRAILYL